MPTVGDLGRVGKCPGNGFTVSAASVAGDDGNLLMPFKPSGRGRRLTIGQQRHRPTSFEIADNRSIAVVAPPCPVIDPDDIQRLEREPCSSADDKAQSVVAHPGPPPSGK